MKVAVSFIKSIYDTKTTIKKIDESNADYIHVDMMDGKFVKNKNFTMGELTKLLGNVSKPLDVHLMVKNPLKYLTDFSLLNTETFIFHLESVDNIEETIEKIKDIGLKVGISIKPKTALKHLEPYLKYLDQVLVMSVEPGAGGQAFKDSSILRIEKLKELREKNNLNFEISVDGGINNETIDFVRDADMVVSGSYICSNTDFNQMIDTLK